MTQASAETPQASAPLQAGAPILRRQNLRLFVSARMAMTFAMQMQNVAIGWYVYALTNDPLSLGLVGLAQFLPAILFILATGHAADRFDRRHVVIICLVAQALASIALLPVIFSASPKVWPIYAIVFALGSARSFSQPALAALLPDIVSLDAFPRAVALSTSSLQAATIIGPAVGGLLLAWNGVALFCLAATLNAIAAPLIAGVTARPARRDPNEATGLKRLLAGFSYLRGNRFLLGAISLDLFAVLFGGVTALLPIFARDILQVGPAGLGLLRSGPAMGAVIVGLILARHPLRRSVGAIMLWSVAAYGVATIVFAFSTSIWLSVAAMIAFGGFDMISMVIRQTMIQLGTPEAMRGRVSAINHVFIGASNQLGDFESSVAAVFLGAAGAAIFGGVGALLVVAFWAWRFPELRRADRLE
ncbi:Major facilitator superfamily MFS_1 [Methylocella tundrae]|uniref:Major facilitator superfamily MFS_1 n=1 Tax=Methylocella tundrae TaxID=227605 RepID=A0A8B6LZV4_METTU|nr:MFS transporter [Methylocella tundrae]VTZ25220.1 Major facilitator superfamily MFS_1 [Methylocella tundrae]VTZ48106.1 Major facilitator superfamily MFS_1 [Methylocella tundrae]